MKNIKILRALTIAVILSLLVILIPASPALAARSIELDPEEGEIGDRVYVDGDGFPPWEPAVSPYPERPSYVDIYFSSQSATTSDDIGEEVEIYELVEEDVEVSSTSAGRFSTYFNVPDVLDDGDDEEDVRGGTYYIYVTWDNEEDGDSTPRIEAKATFIVIAGEITGFDPDSGPVGTEVEISGEGFGENEDITIEYDGDGLDIESGDDETDSGGDFDCAIIIPRSTAGDHTVTVSDESLSEVEVVFTVEPEITISPTQAPPDDSVGVTGTGFGDRVAVFIRLNGELVATSPLSVETDRDGNFTADFTVPDVGEGIYDIEVEDDDGNDATVDFTVEKGIEVSASVTTGHVGTEITISGVGFNANSTITITYTSEPIVVATTTSNADGAFTATFNIPQSEAGAHTITASDGTNVLQVSFTVESAAPPIPAPLLPEMGTKASSQTQFDWEDVTDPSGVTYTLQIATSEDFSATSMILVKTGLTSSEYTLTKEEALESRTEEAPYYWRIKAVDGAFNESGWSGVGAFYVGFSLPSWIIHLWWGLGVLGAALGFYWLGKRRSYYY